MAKRKTVMNFKQLIKELNEKRQYEKAHRVEILTEKFGNMKPFRTRDDIPEIPILEKDDYYEIVVKNLIRCGAIPKGDLIVGETYIGDCRNACEATWNGEVFEYKRLKFGGWFDDKIRHFEDYTEYDVFVPIKLKEKDNGD